MMFGLITVNSNINIMESYFENAIKFKSKRDIYIEKYVGIINESKQKKQQIIDQTIKHAYSGEPLTSNQLFEFGKNIESEFDEYSKNKNKKDDEFKGGIPDKLCFVNHMKFLKTIKPNYYSGEMYHTFDNDGDSHNTKIKKELIKNNSPAKNCQEQYYECITKIQSYEIDIYEIHKNVKQYRNRSWSSLCGKCIPFKFYCGKNNYKFEIKFYDDCDCFPGILSVNEITDTQTGNIIQIHCDLYCQNTSHNELENFMNLINGVDLNSFIKKRFGHFIQLPELFESSEFDVSHPEKLIEDGKATINKYDFTFVINIKNEKGELSLIPYQQEYESSEYALYICGTLNEINKKSEYKYDKININTFNHDLRKSAWKFNYKSSDDFPELLNCIEAYINHKNNEYGYFDGNTYLNDNNVKEFVNNLKFEYNQHLQLGKYSNNYDGPDFDTYIFYTSTLDRTNYSFTYDHLTDYSFPYDFYGIRFWFDKKINPNKCYVTFEGKYYDQTIIANKYYEDEKGFDSNEFDKQINNIDNTNNINDMILFDGTFDECMMKISEFLKTMFEINSEKID